jgi:SAM-dependent methyltransferase
MGWLGDLRGLTVLIVGAGSGELAAMIARAGAQVMATDIDEASVRLTRETARRQAITLETAVMTVEELPAAPLYDLVVATDVIEHIQDDQAAVRKLVSVLRPGGRLVITVPAMPSLFGQHDVSLGHFRRYTKPALAELFAPLVRIEHLRYFGVSLVPVALVLSRWLKVPYSQAADGAAYRPKSLISRVTTAVLTVEKSLNPPRGVALLLIGRKPTVPK